MLSLFLAPATSKAGVELELKGEVAELLANPLELAVGVKGKTEDSGALLLPVRDDACDGGAAVLIKLEAGIMPPVELVTKSAELETVILVAISIRYDWCMLVWDLIFCCPASRTEDWKVGVYGK